MKFLSVLLACVLLLNNLPVFAQEAKTPGGTSAAANSEPVNMNIYEVHKPKYWTPFKHEGIPAENLPVTRWSNNNPNQAFTPAFFERFLDDIIELPQRPLQWDKTDWVIFGSVITLTAGLFLLDNTIQNYTRKHRSSFMDTVSDFSTHFGDWKQQIPLLGGAYVLGVAFEQPVLQKLAADGIVSSIIAAGIVNPTLALVTGRALPNAHEDPYHFRFFTQGRYSFPSGHTTAAFALATAIDQNLRSSFGYLQTPIVYLLAASTAISRVYDQTHFASEVVLGAGVGWAVAMWICNKPRWAKERIDILPMGNGAKLAYKF